MPSQADSIKSRMQALDVVFGDKAHQPLVERALTAANGDFSAALKNLKSKLPAAAMVKLEFAHSLADFAGDNIQVVRALAADSKAVTMRDVALQFDGAKMAKQVKAVDIPDGTPGTTAQEKAKNFAVSLNTMLFASQPTAVLQRMVQNAELPIDDANVRTGVASFLNNQPGFNIRNTSVYTAIRQPEAFKGIAEDHRAGVIENLKTLQRVQAISPVPEAVPVLMKANLTSAFRIAEIPESTFLKAHTEALGEATARQVYTNAINAHIRNEHALITMRDTLRGSGLAIIDGRQTIAERVSALQALTDEKSIPLNLSTLFGSLDFCECEDCVSVYSPAAYFVELLQFLRNNDLGSDPATGDPDPAKNKNIHPGIAGTPLEKLLRRRPDLGCLELTCENTFTVLPYIDLVNEVMESFVVHTLDYHNSGTVPRQVTLEAFNVEGETSSELLAIPQHINYEAYCILKSAVYPFTLPYHQPIDATRIFLKYLGTSRWELLDTFRTPSESCPGPSLTPADLQKLQELHQAVIDRAVDADFLGMTQEEYIILTGEAFWPKDYFDLTQHKSFSKQDYQKNIGVRSVCEYYGYVPPAGGNCDVAMLDDKAQTGLTFVKKQFLPRTGIQFVHLVELLKTRFINPNFPQGHALTLLETVRFSYRYLQTLLDPDPKIRFNKLIALLESPQSIAGLANVISDSNPCNRLKQNTCVDGNDIRNWVLCYFDRIGQLIVLESGEGPQLPFEGPLLLPDGNIANIGTLHKDGAITSEKDGTIIGNVTFDGQVIGKTGKSFIEQFGVLELRINDVNGKLVGLINKKGLVDVSTDRQVTWLPARDTCDLEKVRLIHLDGTSVTVPEYDRIQRFIRLWRKLGYTIDETDKALSGLGGGPDSASSGGAAGGAGGGSTTSQGACEYVGFDTFVDDCSPTDGTETTCHIDGGHGEPNGCPDTVSIDYTISPEVLHQLRAARTLLDQTGFPLAKLLALWADIGTDGEKSLYVQLFLTHNLLGIDRIFEADSHGNYLTQPATISDHIPVLMAALKLKADDIAAIRSFAPVSDSLTLPNVSILYRYSLLAKILHVRVPLLKDVIALFGNPFKSAWSTLWLLETWGKMEDAGFTFRQLDYLILDLDDPAHPLAPSQKTVLQLAKTIFDGLNAIDRAHPDVTSDHKADATGDLIRAKTSLLFDSATVEQIVSLLEGTTVYTTNAPGGLNISIPETDPFSKKLKYSEQKSATPPTASIQVTGIFTDPEILRGKSLSNHPNWPAAIDRAGKQTKNVFDDVLIGIFTDSAAAKKKLLAGDFSNPADSQDPANTAPEKRFYFLEKFLPFLRRQLSQRLIIDTSAAAAGLPGDVTKELLFHVLHVASPAVSAIDALEAIKDKPAGTPAGWKGYLIPTVDADFTFVAIGDTQPPPLTLDGQTVAFSVQQEDPSNVWSSDPGQPVRLKSGKLYLLQVADRLASDLKWKTPASPPVTIPSSSLLPDFSSQATREVFTRLYKAALLVNGFSLSSDEVAYLQSHGAADFSGLDFNGITLAHWLRLQAYADLRNSLPRTDLTLIGLFTWARQPLADTSKLSAKIAAATTWKQEAIDKLIAPDANDAKDHFNLNRTEAFRNEVNLLRLRKALGVADKIAVDIDRLFDWARPGSKFWACHLIADDIRKAARARFNEDDWEQVVKPLNDQLRENQKQALISYCLVQPDLIDWGVVDADSLFEFFLIDVQMDACMETSRVKQAISSVQLFIQRCLLGLEEDRGVGNRAIDRPRWEWMQRYRLWEANRKIFLYPENWIRSELRDDKSAFYKELEGELLQKDVSSEVVEDALKNYLFKVGDVANIRVAAIFRDDKAHQLHIFARTHNAPYLFYYRYFDIAKHNWYPWGKVQVDIPSHDEERDSQLKINGTYLVPVVWNGRILVFIPHFVSKSVAAAGSGQRTPADIGNNSNTNQSKPEQFWEIRIGWSEYRNEKWTPKQLSSDAVYSIDGAVTFSQGVELYNFVPRVIDGPDTRVVIEISFSGGRPFGQFVFAGNQIFRDTAKPGNLTIGVTEFQVISKKVHSFQAVNAAPPALIATEPFFALSDTNVVAHIDGVVSNVSHPFVHELLSSVTTGGTDELYSYLREKVVDTNSAFGAFLNDEAKPSYNELKTPYALYDWEVAFHAPMQVADRLMKAQHYEAALKMCHYVLNPFASGNPADSKRFWQFWPFRHLSPETTIHSLFVSLAPGQPNSLIAEWRDSPFQPHLVARGRPTAYMKWVATTYIRILVAWGDYLFQQDTIEAINQATQLYILAAHVYGPAGQEIPKRGIVKSETYYSLLDKWDAFGNAMVELELAFPFSNQTSVASAAGNGVVGMPNIFGFATSLYFCIPNNPELTALRATIDDRLFKIRHCENIAGVFRKLPLFEPPIDPALLVQAAAQGLSLSHVLNDLNSPIPNYRFSYLLQKALEMCNEVKSLGSAFLSAREKADGEALSRLRATHDSSINNLVMEVRKLQVEESQKAVDALQQSRLAPVSRMEFYLKLIGEKASKVPDAAADFSDLPNQIEQPVDDSSLKLIAYEKEELDKADTAADLNVIAAIPKILEGVLHAIPNLEASVEPIGIGIAATFGGLNLAGIARAASDVLQLASAQMQHESSRASRKAGYLRQLQDRVQQANNAGFEIKSIDKQILTQQIRIGIAKQEIINQQRQIENAIEIEDFLRNKYSSQELYAWMTDQVRGLYYQAYTLAYDLAKRAEKVFRFERGLTTSSFIQFGYWDPAYDGLLSGERLFNGLKQLEAAFQEKRGYDFEIVKNISLQQLNPLELIKLRETGQCEFALPEVLFDMGFPGQYLRRIKSIALTFACHVGPPTSLNCVLRLQEHKFRMDPKLAGNADYPEHTDENDERFNTVNVPITSIAVSTGQNDSGVFDLNSRDERYSPFEGAGVISKWRVQLPRDFREFDYSSITDVVIHMRYTALDGGDKLRAPAEASVKSFISSAIELSRGEGLFALFDLRHDFPNEWYKSTQLSPGATERAIALGDVFERLPVFTKGRKIQAADLYLFTRAAPSGGFSLVQGSDEFTIAGPQAVGTLTSFVAKDIGCPMSGWQIKIKDVKVNIDVLWLAVRYTLS